MVQERMGGDNRKIVIVTGATGLIGKRVIQLLLRRGVQVIAFVRRPKKARKILASNVECVRWDFSKPEKGEWASHLSRADGIVHLAGAPLFNRRWTERYKKKIEQSRMGSVRQLVDAIKELDQKPKAFVTTSAVGIYGTDATRVVDEDAPIARDYFARICVRLEDEARKIEQQNVRSVQVRSGIVLSVDEGALRMMLPLFKWGLGGPIGYSDRFINWIHLDDIASILVMALFHGEMRGAINASAPGPVSMEVFSRTLCQFLGRPCFMKYPTPLLRLLLGEVADYMSGGPRVLSEKIRHIGYEFAYPTLEPALEEILG